jgi:putative SOS response-associated peptidase YedK
MCGRFAQSQSINNYAKALDPAWVPPALDLHQTWNLAPSRPALVFHGGDDGRMAELFKWGLLPSWADPMAQKPINARLDTAATNPYFRKAWKTGRCLIPADGWYEWKISDQGKIPYFLHRADQQPLLMAGLYEINLHVKVTSFAILTMDADGDLRNVHDRKPVVLSADVATQWLDSKLPADEIAAVAAHAMTSEHFTWHTVSTKVNNPRNDDAGLMVKQLYG